MKSATKSIRGFKSVFEVFGIYTHGKLAGQVNPRAGARLTYFGRDFKECKGKLLRDVPEIFYKPVEIVDMDRLAASADRVEKA